MQSPNKGKLVELDSRNRISLAKIGRPEHRRYLATADHTGTITLRPVELVPAVPGEHPAMLAPVEVAADLVVSPDGACPAHGPHPHNGMVCLDCPRCPRVASGVGPSWPSDCGYAKAEAGRARHTCAEKRGAQVIGPGDVERCGCPVVVSESRQPGPGFCPLHGEHPHNGQECPDCPKCKVMEAPW